MLDIEGLMELVKIKLPNNFKRPNIERFDGIGNPKSHIKFYMSVFQAQGCIYEHLSLLFSQTLQKAMLSWHLTLEASKTKT